MDMPERRPAASWPQRVVGAARRKASRSDGSALIKDGRGRKGEGGDGTLSGRAS